MLRIATHNSATGEKGTFLSHLVAIFSRTQHKTIKEQFEAGCRYFDLRFRKSKRKGWKLAHGFWRTKRQAEDIIKELNELAGTDHENVTYACMTFEGKFKNIGNFEEFCDYLNETYTNIKFTSVDAKYSGEKKNPFIVDYKAIKRYNGCPIGGKQGFIPLDGKHWQTYLPLPWLWDQIYTQPHVFNENTFLFVDFL